MTLPIGNYRGTIVGHGTDTNSNGLPLVFFHVSIRNPNTGEDEQVTCRSFLAGRGETDEETDRKTKTALRMTRQALKLCGFDPDVRELRDLDEIDGLLAGVVVPVSVRQKNGYTNYDLILPRGVTPSAASELTSALRSAKSKDEPPVSERPAAPTASAVPEAGAARAQLKEKLDAQFDDIPF